MTGEQAMEACQRDRTSSLDTPTIQGDLSEGRLVRLFDYSIPAIHPYYIVTPPSEHMKPAAKALETWIVEQF